ncbi:MAG: DsbA family protein [Thermoplasmatota archaeon]
MATPPETPEETDAAPVTQPSAWAVAHAREVDTGFFNRASLPPGHVEVILLTDPWSVWCWGFEPVRRAIEHRYPTIHFRHLVGGMFEHLPDPESVGFDVERFFSVVQRTTGMPLRTDATRRDRPQSTYPACIAVAAVRLLRPDLESAYLRQLREAAFLDGQNISKPKVAAKVATTVGINEEEFLEAIKSGEPEREFRGLLARLEAQALRAYPTLLVRVREKVGRVEGFQTLPGLLAIVESVSGRADPPNRPPPLMSIIGPHERVATREVAEVLDIGVEETFERLAELEREGKLVHETQKQGYVWSRPAGPNA